jgi:hypothetical protein
LTGKANTSARVSALDVTLFDAVETELTAVDRQMLLAIQNIVASGNQAYTYLEIGSHKGGSIQPHLLDRRCEAIYSIDPRPASQLDERGHRFHYADNSTKGMLANLTALSPDQVAKIRTFEISAPELVDRNAAVGPVDLVLVDGEHTDFAVERDFEAVLALTRPGSVVVFHDAPITYGAIAKALAGLKQNNIEFSALPLPDSLFVIVIGDATALLRPPFEPLLARIGEAYLNALLLNRGYRSFYRLMPFGIVRSLLNRLGFRKAANAFGYGSDSLGRL